MIRFSSKIYRMTQETQRIKLLQRFCVNKPSKLSTYYKQNQPLQGIATYEATKKLVQQSIQKNIHKDNWRQIINAGRDRTHSPFLSSLGIGTMSGQPSDDFDFVMFQSLVRTLQSKAVNVIDTCANFRYGKSERVINACLNYLIKEKNRKRQQFFIQTKAGFVPTDVDSNLSDKDIIKFLVEQKIVKPQDIVQNIHCVAPGFLNFSVEKSRMTLGLKTIDVVYLNNLAQGQQSMIGKQQFNSRMLAAFETLEAMRSQKRINYYGICSFVSFRSPINQEQVHASLQNMIQNARKVGGQNHGMRFVMLPINLGMPEALLKWQKYKGQLKTISEIAAAENINLVSCTPLFQGRLAAVPFSAGKMTQISSNAGKHLQLMRSINCPTLVSTITSQNTQNHIDQNLKVLQLPRLTPQEWDNILPMPK